MLRHLTLDRSKNKQKTGFVFDPPVSACQTVQFKVDTKLAQGGAYAGFAQLAAVVSITSTSPCNLCTPQCLGPCSLPDNTPKKSC